MADIKDIVAYFCKHYPHKEELSKARLTKLVYLADWKAAIERGKPLTDIEWIYNRYGPYVDDVAEIAMENDDLFSIDPTENYYGENKHVISLKNENYEPSLGDNDAPVLNHIISITEKRYWDDFLKLVYATYPIQHSERFDTLDLEKLADQYNSERQQLQTSTETTH